MPLWLWLLDSLGVILAVTLVALVGLVLRRRYLARRGGAFDLSINKRAEASAKGWTLGVAVYRGNTLEWYRTFSVRLRPRYRFARGEVEVDGRRLPRGAEVHALHTGHVVVATHSATPVQQMAMSPDALTGLLAWLESSPPGRSVNRVV